jgi:Holliday junction resolvase RusA-like endonuclease
MAKSKIKTRKDRLTDYGIKYFNIPKDDPVERIMHCIGDKLTIDKVKKIIKRKNEILKNMTYSCVKLTFYETPAGSNRPRHRSIGDRIMSYVPNAKENKNYFEKLISDVVEDIGIIHTPIFLTLDTYYAMPQNIPLEEQVLFEAKLLHPVVPVDIDNVLKSYTDQMLERFIIDDSLIYRAHLEGFYSFLPRLEMKIYYEDKFAAKYIYKKIKSRKSFERLRNHIELAKVI